MSLRHALLGFLSLENMNGYQLKKHLDQSVGRFWNVSISQIYPTLGDMMTSGLIIVKNDGGDSVRGSKIYHITEKGEKELHRWLTGPAKKDVFRSEMLLKLYFSSQLPADLLIERFSRQKKEAQERIEFCESSIRHLQSRHIDLLPFQENSVYWQMTARFGILKDRAMTDWCDECIRIIMQQKGFPSNDTAPHKRNR